MMESQHSPLTIYYIYLEQKKIGGVLKLLAGSVDHFTSSNAFILTFSKVDFFYPQLD